MRFRLALAAFTIIAIALGAIFAVAIWDTHQQKASRQVHFPISCGATIQLLFDRATARLHSMGYVEAERATTPSPSLNRIARWPIGVWR